MKRIFNWLQSLHFATQNDIGLLIVLVAFAGLAMMFIDRSGAWK